MASEEPLFDPSLKKRKKKQVAFTEDPLGADADPTSPAPVTIDSTTLNGDAVDLGPVTAHERMKANGDEGADKKKEDDDFKAMFGDVKKKKKKKEIPMDFVGRCSVITASIVYSKPPCRATILARPHRLSHPLSPLLLLRQLHPMTLISLISKRRRNRARKRPRLTWMLLRKNSMTRRPRLRPPQMTRKTMVQSTPATLTISMMQSLAKIRSHREMPLLA